MINFVLLHQIDAFNKQVITAEETIFKKYISFDPNTKKWIAIDDTTDDFWVEEFTRIDTAIIWLNNK